MSRAQWSGRGSECPETDICPNPAFTGTGNSPYMLLTDLFQLVSLCVCVCGGGGGGETDRDRCVCVCVCMCVVSFPLHYIIQVSHSKYCDLFSLQV